MNWIFASPWPILIAGLVIEVLLLAALIRSGRGALLAAVAGVGVLTGLLLLVERLIVTETEQVEATLDELSAALVRNDLNAVLAFISPTANDVRTLAQTSLPSVVINEAHIGSDLSIQVNERTNPPTALATFTGRFQFKLVRGASPYENMVRKFRVGLSKQDGRWLIVAVEESDLRKH